MQQQAQVSATVIKQPWDTIASFFSVLSDAARSYHGIFFVSIAVALILICIFLYIRHEHT